MTSLSTLQSDFKGDDLIMGGDYNLVPDLDKDNRGDLAKTHQNSVKIVYEFSEKLDLWTSGGLCTLTLVVSRGLRQRHPRVRRRLDFFFFFLVSQSTVNITTLTDIVAGYKTDHSMITLLIIAFESARGRFLEIKYSSFN